MAIQNLNSVEMRLETMQLGRKIIFGSLDLIIGNHKLDIGKISLKVVEKSYQVWPLSI